VIDFAVAHVDRDVNIIFNFFSIFFVCVILHLVRVLFWTVLFSLITLLTFWTNWTLHAYGFNRN
jgi:hypothetical protein